MVVVPAESAQGSGPTLSSPLRLSLFAVCAALSCGASLPTPAESASTQVRFATFNASLKRDAAGQLLSDLANPLASGGVTASVANRIQQAHNVAEIIQRINADLLLVNAFDFERNGGPTADSIASPPGYSSQGARLFQDNSLSTSHGNAVRGITSGVDDAHRYTPSTNTGVASGFDLKQQRRGGRR